MISSGVAPAPPTDLGSKESTVLQIELVSIIADVISAFGCNPNNSVSCLKGILFI